MRRRRLIETPSLLYVAFPAQLGSSYYATPTHMSAPGPNEKKRDCSLPPGCKDLIDAIRLQSQTIPNPLPPITRRVTLPAVVAVRYLAELLQLSKEDVSALCGYFGERSVPFNQAQKILRKYGIWAECNAA